MKRVEVFSARADRIYLLFFAIIAGWIFLLVGKELFFPAPPIPIIDVAAERAKIDQAGLIIYPGRFYRVEGEEVIK